MTSVRETERCILWEQIYAELIICVTVNSCFAQVVENRFFFALMITSIQPLPVQSKHSLSRLFSTENNLGCFGLSVMSLRVQFSGQWYLELKNAISTSVCLDEF